MTLSTWFRAARMQLYTIAFTPVLLGNVAAWYEHGHLRIIPFLLSAMIALAVHLTTAFVNDIADVTSDESNRFRSMFSGGSGVIIEGRLRASDLIMGTFCTISGAIMLTVIMVIFTGVHWGVLVFLFLGLLSGTGYSLPPLKISYRGGGEFLVLVTYSFGLVGAGYFVQSGTIISPLPWILSIPVGLAVFSLITITQFPDREADMKAGKRSLVIIIGARRTLNIISAAVMLSVISIIIFLLTGLVPIWTGVISLICLPLVCSVLKEIYYHGEGISSYTRLSRATLMLTLWFGTAPVLGLCIDHWLQ